MNRREADRVARGVLCLGVALSIGALTGCAATGEGGSVVSHVETAATTGGQGAVGVTNPAQPAEAEAEAILANTTPEAAGGPLTEVQDVDLLATLPPPSRPRKRMDIDQLDAALQRVSGGIGWTSGKGATLKNEFETLAITLGKPNYTDLTTEDLEPTALFQKFLGDAATAVCTKLIDVELDKAPADRVFLVGIDPSKPYAADPKANDANLALQLLRFHGRVVDATGPELARWRFLLQGATQITGKASEGWRAVCVALVEHPAFTTY